MTNYSDHTAAIQDLGSAVIEIAQINVPELELTDEMLIEDKWYELSQDDAWWDAWCTIYDLVEDTVGSAQAEESHIRPGVERHRQYDSIETKNEYVELQVKVYADGHVDILAEYDNGDESTWAVLFDEHASEVDPIEIGREVASAELALLARKMGSCAEVLDYWQVNHSAADWRQRWWADARGVGRQAVNNNIQSAQTALVRDYGPTELHEALNSVEEGDALDFAFISGDRDNVTGGGIFRVDEVIEPFGDGTGEIRCENDVDDVVTTIHEMSREDDQRVMIHQDGEAMYTGGYVSIE